MALEQMDPDWQPRPEEMFAKREGEPDPDGRYGRGASGIERQGAEPPALKSGPFDDLSAPSALEAAMADGSLETPEERQYLSTPGEVAEMIESVADTGIEEAAADLEPNPDVEPLPEGEQTDDFEVGEQDPAAAAAKVRRPEEVLQPRQQAPKSWEFAENTSFSHED